MSKQFMIILAAIVIIFGGLLIFNKKKSEPAEKADAKPSNHVIEGSSGVTLTEYADFQCPGCGATFPIVQQLHEKYKDKVTFRFRHFPIVTIHQFAMQAAKYAEAAGEQGKFWEMHDKLFENQRIWSSGTSANELFDKYAEDIGLDMDKFREDVKSEKVNETIKADMAEGRKHNVTGTPTFYLDDKKIEPKSLEDFEKLIDEALKNKQSENKTKY